LGGYDGDEPQAGKKKHKRLKKGTGSSNTTASRKTDDTVAATKKDQKKKKKKKKKKSNSSSGNGKKYQSTLLSEHFSTQTNNKHKMKKSKPTTYKQHSFKNNSLSKSTSTIKSKSTNTEMWIDKHAPQSIKEICVAPKKIEEVRQFLNSHVEYTTYQHRRTNHNKQHQQQQNNETTTSNPWDIPTNPSQPTTKLQILVGSPGIGKSTLLSVLATELNIEVLRWNDIHVDYNMNSGGAGEYGMGRESGGGGGHLPYQHLRPHQLILKCGLINMHPKQSRKYAWHRKRSRRYVNSSIHMLNILHINVVVPTITSINNNIMKQQLQIHGIYQPTQYSQQLNYKY